MREMEESRKREYWGMKESSREGRYLESEGSSERQIRES